MSRSDTSSGTPPIVEPIRNAVRALIYNNNHLLLLRKEYPDSAPKYALPGGGQSLGETLEQTLIRECEEEIGCRVKIESLLHIADFFKTRDTEPVTTRHQVEFFFRCLLPADYVPRNGMKPDRHQVAVEWIELSSLKHINIFPSSLPTHLELSGRNPQRVYVGELPE